MNLKDTKRFWSKVQIGNTDACWEWQAYKTKQGYGHIWMEWCMLSAHRVAWELSNGPIPAGLSVCHHCDNPSCCNPAHLFIGTIADNKADSVAKNRQARGVAMNTAKLTESDVQEIRGWLKRGMPQRAIAAKYNVTKAAIGHINTGRCWGWLEGTE